MDVLVSTRVDDVDDRLLEIASRAATAALEELGATGAELSLVLGTDADLCELNRQWRGVDATTDVLSFPMEEAEEGEPRWDEDEEEPWLIGDVIVSLTRAQAQAEEYGHSVERELAFLVVHGTLHLLGFDHETDEERQEMRGREEAVLQRLGLGRH